ncbi:MAG: CotH kinase family protein, partial [Chloroflexota bacterium]
WDQTWGDRVQQPLYELEDFGMLENAPLFNQVFNVERYRQKYAAYLDLLARHWFNRENIYTQAQFFHNQIAPYVIQSTGDKVFFGDYRQFNYAEFEINWISLSEFAGQRSQFILNNLSVTPTPPPLED